MARTRPAPGQHSVGCAALSPRYRPTLGQPPFRTCDFVDLLGNSEQFVMRDVRKGKVLNAKAPRTPREEEIKSSCVFLMSGLDVLGVLAFILPPFSVALNCRIDVRSQSRLSPDRPQHSAAPTDAARRPAINLWLTARNLTKSKRCPATLHRVASGCTRPAWPSRRSLLFGFSKNVRPDSIDRSTASERPSSICGRCAPINRGAQRPWPAAQ